MKKSHNRNDAPCSSARSCCIRNGHGGKRSPPLVFAAERFRARASRVDDRRRAHSRSRNFRVPPPHSSGSSSQQRRVFCILTCVCGKPCGVSAQLGRRFARRLLHADDGFAAAALPCAGGRSRACACGGCAGRGGARRLGEWCCGRRRICGSRHADAFPALS